MIVNCIAATLDLIEDATLNGIPFNVSNLKQLESDIKNKEIPILEEFKNEEPIGYVINAEIKEFKLHIVAKLNEDIHTCYIVPGFKIIDAGSGDEFLDIELFAMGTTMLPADSGVTLFKVVKW